MLKKQYILIFILSFNALYSQLKLDVELINSIVHITIINKSEDYYMIPIDKKHFRPYEENCNNFSEYESEFPSFGLLINIINEKREKINYTIGYKYFENSDSSINRINMERKTFQNRINDWSRKNNINDYYASLINYNLIKNIMFFKPNEKKEFKVRLDLKNITSQELIFYNYFLEENENYQFYLSLCDFDSFHYLTLSQKMKYKKYKPFKGELKSNIINLDKGIK